MNIFTVLCKLGLYLKKSELLNSEEKDKFLNVIQGFINENQEEEKQ